MPSRLRSGRRHAVGGLCGVQSERDVEEAHPPEDLDAGDLRERLKRAESEMESCEADSEAYRKAARDKRRWETFLAIAEGGGS